MAVDRVKRTEPTALERAVQSEEAIFADAIRRSTPAADNLPPGLERQAEAGRVHRNWKLAGQGDEADAGAKDQRQAARPA